MPRLQEVLREASVRDAYELIMESGQPVVLTTAKGPEALGGVLEEGDLIDALTHVLDDEQQVELAVGNLIEFQIDTDAGRWTLVTEPVADGLLVRGRRQNAPSPAASGRGSAVDLPPLAPFLPPSAGDPLAAPGAHVDASRANRPTAKEAAVDFGGPAPEPTPRLGSSEFDVDLEAEPDEPATGNTLMSGVGAPPPPVVPAATGAAPGNEAPLDDLDFGGPASAANRAAPGKEAPLDDLDFGGPASSGSGLSDATLFTPAGGPAPLPGVAPAERPGVSAGTDLGFGAPDSTARQRKLDDTLFIGSDPRRPAGPPHGTGPGPGATAAFDDQPLGIPNDDDDASFADLNVELEVGGGTSRPPPSAPLDPNAFAGREAPMDPPTPTPPAGTAAEGLGALAGSIEPGTLCFVHGHGVAEELAEHIGVPFAVVGDGPEGTRAMQSLLEGSAEPGTAIVRLEDPSAQLGFLLRRLEEGWRVLVETRARTAEGARRILLGVGASACAEAWLAAQVTSWAVLEAGRWVLLHAALDSHE